MNLKLLQEAAKITIPGQGSSGCSDCDTSVQSKLSCGMKGELIAGTRTDFYVYHLSQATK